MKGAGSDPARAAIDREILAWMRSGIEGYGGDGRGDSGHGDHARGDERFERLALELFALQFERCAPFRRFCEARGRTPRSVTSWRDVPPVPTGVFKEVELRSFPSERTLHTFRTSGTTGESRGALHLDTLALYEASLLPTFRRFVLPDLAPGARALLRVLAPPPSTAADSSLSHMFGVVVGSLGAPGSGFDVDAEGLRLAPLRSALGDAIRTGEPIALCGTAFAFVHLLDAMAERGETFALPPGSRVMETGGFKGRSREVERPELYAAIERRLAVPADRIVNQYGMTELGSQFYDSVLARPGEPRRKLGPPWARVWIADPERGTPAPPGEVGMIAVADLANTGSVFAVLTADLGRARGDGFEILGRDPSAESRGCSLAADELLGGIAS